MRGKLNLKRKPIQQDPKFGSLAVGKLVNYVMKDGKKSVAQSVVYNALEQATAKLKAKDTDQLLVETLRKIAPIVEVRSRRIGGANYQIPMEVKEPRKTALAMRWLLDSARSVKGRPMAEKLADEIVNVANGTGGALKKREDVHKMAEANRAYAHFTRY
jgi:small subunit ribosomal protein S7